jgi:hypothetical protein
MSLRTLVSLFLCALAIPTATYAESITYTFTGSSDFAGTHFTYVDPNGFLSFGATVAPTTATDLFYSGVDKGSIVSLQFVPYFLDMTTLHGGFALYQPNSYSLSLLGTQQLGGGSLNIEPTPASVTPEPSSIILLATGMMGIAFFSRRRIFHSGGAAA